MAPRLSVCIPAYNRPQELVDALESIAGQGAGDWNIFIIEDCSPQRQEIAEAVGEFSGRHPELEVHFSSNKKNLGYDRNLRRLLDTANGEYCLFLGDDDLLAPGALSRIMGALALPDTGFVLRAWKSVDKETGRDVEEHRYFHGDRMFPPGKASIAAFYRRSVFISGLTVHRETARTHHTDRFDGMLLYQLHLVGRILMEQSGFYVSDCVAIRRLGGDHFFGSSELERGRFTPRELLPAHSVEFLRGLFSIARVLENETCPGVFEAISRDLGRYSYPMLEIQARRLDRMAFRKYAHELAGLGLGRYFLFRFYYLALLSFGPRACDFLICSIKRILGRTPSMGGSTGLAVR